MAIGDFSSGDVELAGMARSMCDLTIAETDGATMLVIAWGIDPGMA